MAIIDKEKKELAAYEQGPFEDLQVQEALTIIAIYAARMDYKNCEADVKRLAHIFERHPMFLARKKEILAILNKYVNSMEAGDPHQALDKAAEALTREQKNAAFELAVEAAQPEGELTADESEMFAALKTRLSISDELAQRALGAYKEGN